MLELRLRELVQAKAEALGLKAKDIKIKKSDPFRHPGLYIVDDTLSISLKSGNIILTVGDVSKFSSEDLERAIEHLVCSWKDREEEIFGEEIVSLPDILTQGLARLFYSAYTGYFTSKRQIDVFGSEKYGQYQMRGLQEFVQKTDKRIRGYSDNDSAMLAIVSMYKEQIKCRLMESDPRMFPLVIALLAGPLPDAFERINSSGLPWINKSEILLMMAMYHGIKIALRESYMHDQLRLTRQVYENISAGLKSEDFIDDATFRVAADVERMLTNHYALFSTLQRKPTSMS